MNRRNWISKRSPLNVKRSLSRRDGRVRAAAPLIMLAVAGSAVAAPEGERVVAGDASFHRNGSTTVIRADHNTIIDYSSFNIASGETVRFIQPSSNARVLNRVRGPATHIHGTLTANGHVYIVNQAGIFFGDRAVVSAGRVYAAAARITNEDFLSGRNRFTDALGKVENRGLIEGDRVHLFGRSVSNYGTILSPQGVVTMHAGRDLLIGEQGGNVFVRVDGAADHQQGQTDAGVVQAGRIDAGTGRVMIGAGDLYSLAIRPESSIRGSSVRIEGGSGSTVWASGVIDVSDSRPSETTASALSGGTVGGDVFLLGDRVAVTDATIDASGEAGGGTVLVGGDYQGLNSEVRNATSTWVGPGTTIDVSATLSGNGGTTILWSDLVTRFFGEIKARGGRQGGDGGFVEVSGKEYLRYEGLTDTLAENGNAGTLLLDPGVIRFRNGGADDADLPADPNNLNVDFGLDGTNEFDILKTTLATFTGDVVLQATHRIEAQSGGGDLVLNAALTSLTLETRNAAGDESGAGAGSDTGGIFMDGVTIDGSAGNTDIILRAGTNGSEFVAIDVAAINVGSGSVTLDTTSAGTVTSGATGNITLNGAITAGGAIDVDARALITIADGADIGGGSTSIDLNSLNSTINFAGGGTGTTLTAASGGTVSLTTGATGNINFNNNVTLDLLAGSLLSTIDAGGIVRFNDGSSLLAAATAGGVTITGDDGAGAENGVQFNTNSTVTFNDGATLTADSGSGLNVDTALAQGTISLSAAGDLTINQAVGDSTVNDITLAADSDGDGAGTLTIGASGTVGSTANTGTITLRAHDFAVGAADVIGDDQTTVVVETSTVSRGIAVNSTPGGVAEVATNWFAQNGGMLQLIIGRADGTGDVDVTNLAGINTPTLVRSAGAGGSVTLGTFNLSDVFEAAASTILVGGNLTSLNDNAITLTGAVSSGVAGALTIDTDSADDGGGGTVTITGGVNGAATDLIIDAGGADIVLGDGATTNSLTLTGGNLNLAGSLIAGSSPNLAGLTGSVVLTGDAVIDSGTSALTIGTSIVDDAGGPYTLGLNGNVVTLTGGIAAGNVSTLTITSEDGAAADQAININTGAIDIGTLVLNGSDLNLGTDLTLTGLTTTGLSGGITLASTGHTISSGTNALSIGAAITGAGFDLNLIGNGVTLSGGGSGLGILTVTSQDGVLADQDISISGAGLGATSLVLDGLDLNLGTSLTLGGSPTVTNLTGGIVLTDNGAAISTGTSAALNITSGISGAFNLALTGNGVTLSGGTTGIGTLTITSSDGAAQNITIGTATVDAAGLVLDGNNLDLSTTLALDSSPETSALAGVITLSGTSAISNSAGLLTIGSGIAGNGNNLTLTGAGVTATGAIAGVGTLDVNSTGAISLGTATGIGVLDLDAGTAGITLTAGADATTLTLTAGSTLTLGGNVTLTGSAFDTTNLTGNLILGAASVAIDSGANGINITRSIVDDGTDRDLSLTGSTIAISAIGAGNVGTLTINGTGAFTVGGNTDVQTLTLTAATDLNLNADLAVANGLATAGLSGAFNLGANATIDTGLNAIDIDQSVVGGGNNLQLDGGAINLAGASNLGTLDINATGLVTIEGATAATGLVSVDASSIQVSGTLDTTSGGITLNGDDGITIDAAVAGLGTTAGAVIIDADANADTSGLLDVNAAIGSATLSESVTLSGEMIDLGASVIATGTNNLSLLAGDSLTIGAVTVGDAALDGTLTLRAETLSLDGSAVLTGIGTLAIEPGQADTAIEISDTPVGGGFAVDPTAIAASFASVAIGQSAGTHAVTVNGATFVPNVTINGGSISLEGSGTTLTSSGSITLNAPVTIGADNLTVQAGSTLTFNDTVTDGASTFTFSVDAGAASDLTMGGLVTLGTLSVVESGNAILSAGATLDDLQIASTNVLQTSGTFTISAALDIDSAGGGIDLATGLTLIGNTVFDTGAQSLTIDSAIVGNGGGTNRALTLNGTVVTLTGGGSDLGALVINSGSGASSIAINSSALGADSLTLTGTTLDLGTTLNLGASPSLGALSGVINLTANSAINTGASSLTLGSAVTGNAFDLALTGNGVTLNGGGTGTGTLSVTSNAGAGAIVITQDETWDTFDLNGGQLSLGAKLEAVTSLPLTNISSIELTANATLQQNAGTLTIDKAITSQGAGRFDLTLNGPAVTIQSATFADEEIGLLDLVSAGTVTLSSNVFAEAVQVNAGTLVLDAALTTDQTGALTIQSGSGTFDIDTLTLGGSGAGAINAAGADLTLASGVTIGGANDLSVQANSLVLPDIAGGLVGALVLDVAGTISLGATDVGSLTLTDASDLTIGGNLTIGNGGLSTTGLSGSLILAGDFTIDAGSDDINITRAIIDDGTDRVLTLSGNNITVSGGIAADQLTQLNATATGFLSLAGGVDVATLDLEANEFRLGGALNTTGAVVIGSNAANAINIAGGFNLTNNASITSANAVQIDAAIVDSGSDRTLTLSGSTVAINSAISAADSISTLSITSAGTVGLNATDVQTLEVSGTTLTLGGDLTLASSFDTNDATNTLAGLVIGADLTINTGANALAIDVGVIDDGTSRNLTLTSGPLTLTGGVTDGDDAGEILALDLNTSTLNLSGNVDVNSIDLSGVTGAVVLEGDTSFDIVTGGFALLSAANTISSSGGLHALTIETGTGLITLGGGIRDSVTPTDAGVSTLMLDTSGVLRFGTGVAGQATIIESLAFDVSTPSQVVLGSDFTSTGAGTLSFGGANIVLDQAAGAGEVAITGGGAIDLTAQTLNATDNESVSITAAGTLTLGVIGDTTPPTDLTFDGTLQATGNGNVDVNGDIVGSSDGDVTVDGSVGGGLGSVSSIMLTSNTGAVNVNGALVTTGDITLNAATGVTATATIGASGHTGAIAVDGDADNDGTGAVVLVGVGTAGGTTTVDISGESLTLSGATLGTGAFTLTADNGITSTGPIGTVLHAGSITIDAGTGAAALAALGTANAGGTTQISVNGASIGLSGAVSVHGDATFTADSLQMAGLVTSTNAGTITLVPITNTRAINLLGAAGTPGGFNVNTSAIAGFSTVVVGREIASGGLHVYDANGADFTAFSLNTRGVDTFDTGGTFDVGGDFTVSGDGSTFTVGGNLGVGGNFTSNDQLRIVSAAGITVSGDININGGLALENSDVSVRSIAILAGTGGVTGNITITGPITEFNPIGVTNGMGTNLTLQSQVAGSSVSLGSGTSTRSTLRELNFGANIVQATISNDLTVNQTLNVTGLSSGLLVGGDRSFTVTNGNFNASGVTIAGADASSSLSIATGTIGAGLAALGPVNDTGGNFLTGLSVSGDQLGLTDNITVNGAVDFATGQGGVLLNRTGGGTITINTTGAAPGTGGVQLANVTQSGDIHTLRVAAESGSDITSGGINVDAINLDGSSVTTGGLNVNAFDVTGSTVTLNGTSTVGDSGFVLSASTLFDVNGNLSIGAGAASLSGGGLFDLGGTFDSGTDLDLTGLGALSFTGDNAFEMNANALTLGLVNELEGDSIEVRNASTVDLTRNITLTGGDFVIGATSTNVLADIDAMTNGGQFAIGGTLNLASNFDVVTGGGQVEVASTTSLGTSSFGIDTTGVGDGTLRLADVTSGGDASRLTLNSGTQTTTLSGVVTAGGVTLTGAGTLNTMGITTTASGVALDLSGATTVLATNASTTFQSAGALSFGNALLDASTVVGSASIALTTAGGDISVGAIDGSANGLVNGLNVTAAGGNFSSSGPINIAADFVLDDVSDVTLNNPIGDSLGTSVQNVSIDATGDVMITGTIRAGLDVSIGSTISPASITLDGNGSDAVVGGGSAIHEIFASGPIQITGGYSGANVNISSSADGVTAQGFNVTSLAVSGATGVVIDAVQASGIVSVASGAAGIQAGDIESTLAQIDLTSTGGTIGTGALTTAGNPVTINAGGADVTTGAISAGAGNLDASSIGTLRINGATGVNTLSLTSVTRSEFGGDVTINAFVPTGVGTIAMVGGGTHTVQVSGGAGDLDLEGITLTGDGATGVLISAGDLTLGTVNGASPLTSLVYEGGGAADVVRLTGDITVNGMVSFDAPTRINGAIRIAATDSMIELDSVIEDPASGAPLNTLTLASGTGNVSIQDLDLDALVIESAGRFFTNGGMTVRDDLSFANVSDRVEFGGVGGLIDATGNTIDFGGTQLTGNRALVFNASDVLLDAVNGSGSGNPLSISFGDAGTNVTLRGDVSIDGPADFMTNVAGVGLGAGGVVMVDVRGGIDAGASFADLSTSDGSGLSVLGDPGSALSFGSVSLDSFTLAGGDTAILGAVQTNQAQDYTGVGRVTLGGAAGSFRTDRGGSSAETITFGTGNIITGQVGLEFVGSTVTLGPIGDFMGADPTSLSVTADTLNIDGTVNIADGMTAGTATVNIAAQTINQNADLSADGSIDYTLAGAGTVLNLVSDVAISTPLSGPGGVRSVTLPTIAGASGGGLDVSAGTVRITGPATLQNTLAVQASSGAAIFNGALDAAAFALQSMDATFGGDVTSGSALDLSQLGNVTLAGAGTQSFDAMGDITFVSGQTLGTSTGAGASFDAGSGNQISLPTVTGLSSLGVSAQTLRLRGDVTVADVLDFSTNIVNVVADQDVTLDNSATTASITLADLSGSGVTTRGQAGSTLTVANATNSFLTPFDQDIVLTGDLRTSMGLDFTQAGSIQLAPMAGSDTITIAPGTGDPLLVVGDRRSIDFSVTNPITGAGNLSLVGDEINLFSVMGIDGVNVVANTLNLFADITTGMNGIDFSLAPAAIDATRTFTSTGTVALGSLRSDANGADLVLVTPMTELTGDILLQGGDADFSQSDIIAVRMGSDVLIDTQELGTAPTPGSVNFADNTIVGPGTLRLDVFDETTMASGTVTFDRRIGFGGDELLGGFEITAANIDLPDVATSGAQRYHLMAPGAVFNFRDLAGDDANASFFSTVDADIEFDGEIDSATRLLRTENGTGFAMFRRDVMLNEAEIIGNVSLGAVTGNVLDFMTMGNATLGRDTTNPGSQIALTSGSDIQVQSVAGNLLFDGAINGDADFAVLVERNPSGIVADADLPFGETTDIDVLPTIRFSSSIGDTTALNSVRFNLARTEMPTNAGGIIRHRGAVPRLATIVMARIDGAGNPLGGSFQILSDGDVMFGALEKLTVLGNIRVDAPGGGSSLGSTQRFFIPDITASGSITVATNAAAGNASTPSIILLNREPGLIYGIAPGSDNQSLFSPRGNDDQTDLVSGTGVSLGVAPGLATPGGAIFRSSSSSSAGPTVANVIQHVEFDGVTSELLFFIDPMGEIFFLDLRAQGLAISSLATALAGALPQTSNDTQPVTESAVSSAARQQLLQIGIFAKDEDDDDRLRRLLGILLFDDLPGRPNPQISEYEVSTARLPGDAVQRVLGVYQRLFGESSQQFQLAADESARQQMVRESISTQWSQFSGQQPGGSAAGFVTALLDDPDAGPVLASLELVSELLDSIEGLGLTDTEMAISRSVLVQLVKPPAMPAETFDEVLTLVRRPDPFWSSDF